MMPLTRFTNADVATRIFSFYERFQDKDENVYQHSVSIRDERLAHTAASRNLLEFCTSRHLARMDIEAAYSLIVKTSKDEENTLG